MPTVQKIIILHDQYVTSAIGRYKSRLEQVVADAIALTLSELHRKLTLDSGGRIASTAGNQRVLRSIDSIFAAKMEAAGLPALSEAFAKSFAGQLPFLDDILDTLSAGLGTPLPDVREVIGAEERRLLASQQLSTIDSLQSAVDQVAAVAKQQVLFSINGLKASELSLILSRALGRTTATATTLADTAMTTFWRSVGEQAYDTIQRDIPNKPLRFEYFGPLDDITRLYCRQMLARTRRTPLTKDEINGFPNGSLPNPFVTCGGFNCRHSYSLSLRD